MPDPAPRRARILVDVECVAAARDDVQVTVTIDVAGPNPAGASVSPVVAVDGVSREAESEAQISAGVA